MNVPTCPPDYNTADYLLEVASDPPVGLFQVNNTQSIISQIQSIGDDAGGMRPLLDPQQATTPVNEKTHYTDVVTERTKPVHRPTSHGIARSNRGWRSGLQSPQYATTFLTQLEILCGREMKILRRYVRLVVHLLA